MTEEEKNSVVHRLSMMRLNHPELQYAEAEARLELASAIMKMDEQDAKGEGHHSLNEQHAVNIKQTEYAQALANLIRGETE